MAGNSSTNQTRRDQFSPGAQNYADTPFKQPGMPSTQMSGMGGDPISQGPYPDNMGGHPNDTYGMGGETGNGSPQEMGAYGLPLTGSLSQQNGNSNPTNYGSYNFDFSSGGGYSPNPYLGEQAQNITRGFNRNLQEQVLPGLRSKFIGSGGLGGSRQGIAEGLAAGRSGEGLSSALTNLYASDYENSQNRNMQGRIAGMNAGIQARGMDLNNELARLNSERNFYSTNRGQDISQLGLAAGLLGQANQGFLGQGQGIYGLGQMENQAPWQQLQNYAGLIGPFSQAGATNTGSQTYTYNPWMQGIGLGVQGASALFGAPAGGTSAAQGIAAMFSDARLKENIKPVGETYDGLTTYTYNYKGDDTPQMGVMAQEVERKKPEALGPTINGFKTVRYGLLG